MADGARPTDAIGPAPMRLIPALVASLAGQFYSFQVLPGSEAQARMDYAVYIASLFGAVALFLMMPRRGFNPRKIGALLGAVTLGGLWLVLARDDHAGLGLPGGAWPYYYIFSALAIGAAVRVITHTRPVYAALWFVMVVLASAGLFLVLSASFMAVAMVIIYGGAILVTYVFVLMLAAQSGETQDADTAVDYDRVSREPVAAIATGFLLLAVLLSAIFRPVAVANTVITTVADADQLQNTQRVGMDLFQKHPLGLELAGVILLVALVGAVVIARRQVEPDDSPKPEVGT